MKLKDLNDDQRLQLKQRILTDRMEAKGDTEFVADDFS